MVLVDQLILLNGSLVLVPFSLDVHQHEVPRITKKENKKELQFYVF